MDNLDLIIYLGMASMVVGFIYIVWSYAKSLKSSPRELYLLFFTKLTEYSAYGAMNLAFVLFLTSDIGMGDISAGSYIGIWSVSITIMTMLVGAIVDAIGVKKTLLAGTIVLLISRLFLPLSTNIYFVSILGFIPMGLGMAMMGPVLSVGIKKYTTKETAALGFGLFYTMMNVGWAIGAWLFDTIRGVMGEHGNFAFGGFEFSTYQIIFTLGFFFTLPDLIAVLCMRNNVEMDDEKGIVFLEENKTERDNSEGMIASVKRVIKNAAVDTVRIFKEVVKEKAFWTFLFMLGTLIFVRLVFYHFHYTFPKYAIRVLGEGLKIGSIFGVLNPVMIVFLTPLFAALTKRVSSYKVMMVGTFISALSVFIATMPETLFMPLVNTWFGELVFDRWLDVPVELRNPVFLSLVIFVAIFTIGEALWSPRLMQFTAEIAPKGKEGSYISLSYLPYFAAKLFVGPLSGWLVATYTPEGASSYPNHAMVWVWIGGMAALSPICLVVFKKMFIRAEIANKEAALAEEKANKDSTTPTSEESEGIEIDPAILAKQNEAKNSGSTVVQ
jgi:MFS family permease